MGAIAHARSIGRERGPAAERVVPWLAAALAVGIAVRFSTLTLQSLWFDEAYTPVHVLAPSLGATLSAVARHENTPPLWYVAEWAITRVLGTDVYALRLLSALAGVALVALGWLIGREAGSRRGAAILAALLAVNPLFVWYSQEARAYELFALACAAGLWCLLRERRTGSRRALAGWAAWSALALLTHYFAVFLVAPQALLVLRSRLRDRTRLLDGALACGAVAAVAAALVPLVLRQGGHGTQWIGQWALSDRVVQIAGYYLLGANGAVLGHGLLLLCALPVLAGIGLLALLWARGALAQRERSAIALTGGLGLAAVGLPLALALAGADYMAPRNLIAAYVPLSAALALALGAPAAGRAGSAIAAAVCAAGLAVVVATDLSPRLQRSDWSAVAARLADGPAERAVVTVELGAAPLEYYLPRARLHYLTAHRIVAVREIDLVGYAPLRPHALRPPTPAFRAAGTAEIHGLLIARYRASTPQRLSGLALRRLTITVATAGEALGPSLAATHWR